MSRRITLHVASFAVLCALAFTCHADNRVLIIGIDGAGGRYLQAADTPNIDALIALGAARYDYLNEGALVPNPPSGYGASGVNWSTIVTGASAAHHGVTDNSFAGSHFDLYPHFFKYVKDHNPASYTASIVSWEPINGQILANQFANLELQFTGSSATTDTLVRNAAVSLFSQGNPNAVFLHFDQVDAAGHSSGWGSAAYNSALQTVDTYVGNVTAAVSARPGVQSGTENWLVIITADHGGLGTSHDASQGLIDWEVPFIVSGSSVPDGLDLQRGTLRDVTSTALWHLGVDPFAAGLDGTVRGIPVNPPNGINGDVNQDGVVSGNGSGPAATDDVTAFLQNWLAAGSGGVLDRYRRGDLNFDGVTDLADWALLQNAQPAIAAAVMEHLNGVPEPNCVALFVFVLTANVACRRRIRSSTLLGRQH